MRQAFFRHLAAFVIGALLLAGCLARVHTPYRGGGVSAVSTGAFAASTQSRPARPQLRLGTAEPPREGLYQVYEFEMPSSGDNRQPGNRVWGSYFRSTHAGRKGLVIILPIWGNSHYPGWATTRHLLRGPTRGRLNVLLVKGEVSLFDWDAMARALSEASFEREARAWASTLSTTAVDMRRLIDWAQGRPEIDPRRIGIVGFSIGAIVSSLVMGLDPRLATGVSVMGGGDLTQIFGFCNGEVGRTRTAILRRLGWSVETFKRKLEPILGPVSPMRYAGAIDPARVLVLDALSDACMPRSDLQRFWEGLGRPERISIQSGHNGAFLAMTPLDRGWATRAIVEFLDRGLGEDPIETVLAASHSNQ